MNKENIHKTIANNKAQLQLPDINVSDSGKSISFRDYKIKVVMSKYGYEDMFGLCFFLRAVNKYTLKYPAGKFDPFDEVNEIDFNPRILYGFKKDAKALLTEIYGSNLQLLSNQSYFCALDDKMLSEIVVLVLAAFADYIDTRATTEN
jgi:hypothetical protein